MPFVHNRAASSSLGSSYAPVSRHSRGLDDYRKQTFDLVGATIEMVEEPGRIDDCERTLQLCTDCGYGNRQSVIPKLAQARGTSLSPDDSVLLDPLVRAKTSPLLWLLHVLLQTCFNHPKLCVRPTGDTQRGRWVGGSSPNRLCYVRCISHGTCVFLHALYELLEKRRIVRVVHATQMWSGIGAKARFWRAARKTIRTRTPNGSISSASDSVKAFTAALLAR